MAATACAPSAASPTTVMSGWASTSIRKPARTRAWSSTMNTRIVIVCRRSPGRRRRIRIRHRHRHRHRSEYRQQAGTRGRAGRSRRQWQRHGHLVAAALPRPGDDRAAVNPDPLPHADQPVPAPAVADRVRRRRRAATVVSDCKLEMGCPEMQLDPCGGRRPAVPQDVGQPFLHDPVHRQPQRGRQRHL